MIPIVLTFWKRPAYARECLAALSRCDGISDCVVLPQVEPGNDEVRAIVESIDFAECRPAFHRERLGCAANSWSAWSAGFTLADFVAFVEEDIVLAPDALAYFRYCRDTYRADPGVSSVTAYHRRPSPAPPSEHHAIRRRSWFHGWGSAMWRDRWDVVSGVVRLGHSGWDGRVLAEFGRLGMMEVYPELARCQNIGVETSLQTGPEFTPGWYAEHHTLRHWHGTAGEVARGVWHEPPADPDIVGVGLTPSLS